MYLNTVSAVHPAAKVAVRRDQVPSVDIEAHEAPPKSRSIPSRLCNTIFTVLGMSALAAAALGLTARYVPITNHVVLIAAALSPVLMLGAFVAVVLFVLRKRWILSAAACCLAIAVVWAELPLYTHDGTRNDEAVRIRVMTANLYLGQADAAHLVEIASTDADVLAVQELTPQAVQRLSEAGLENVMPYRALDARDYASGVGLWSRYPIAESKRFSGFELAMISGRIDVASVVTGPTILVAHLPGPWPQPIVAWQNDTRRMSDTMRDVAVAAGPACVIVAGDFNSTPDMKPFRDLLRGGYRDAVEQAGAGVVPTWPGNAGVPALIAIDHVLTYQCTATSASVVKLPRSDHRGLVSTIEIP